MSKVLIGYYSETGNTQKMAEVIEESIKEEGLEVVNKKIEDILVDELLDYEVIVFGSPTYYGTLAWPIKKLLDESVKFHGKLKGKIGAAFTSAANIGGGNETTILSILEAFLIHGMIVQGNPKGDHYGPVGIGSPDERALKGCRYLGKMVADLVKKIATA
ncbi:flavodoxin domain-containing protein [candidate division NPL-UPA2 bacterium]|nr:flavodoxin domain-containing protein [candidate division NPL-UPA2 bacterium]